MAERISFYEDELIFILSLLKLKLVPGMRFNTQRGSVVIAERNGVLFSVKIAAKDKFDTEYGIVPSRSQGILNEIEIAKKLGGSPFVLFDSQAITDKFIAASFSFIEGVSGFHIPTEHRIRAIYDLYRAVAEIHSLGYTHGDIHPGNIIFKENFSDSYSVALIDLELSCNVNNVACAYPGKVNYLSSESAKDIIKTASIQKLMEQDIYAFGVSALAILSGKEIKRFNIDGLSRKQKLEYIASEKLVFDSSQVNDSFKGVAQKILEIINKPEALRPRSVAEFVDKISLDTIDIQLKEKKDNYKKILSQAFDYSLIGRVGAGGAEIEYYY